MMDNESETSSAVEKDSHQQPQQWRKNRVLSWFGNRIETIYLVSYFASKLKSEPSHFRQGPSKYPSWTLSHKTTSGKPTPQTISHRGYRAIFPENTLASFEGAIAAKTDAIETDIHLTKDNVVVLSHDPDLSRCFGDARMIKDCTYDEILELDTLKEPKQKMPRLIDLLAVLAKPENASIWLLLDIKLTNPVEEVMSRIASTLRSVPSNSCQSWEDRIVLGVWSTEYLPLCVKYLPDYAIVLISGSTYYASRLLKSHLPNIGFNLLLAGLYVCPSFIRKAHTVSPPRPVYVWTVDDTNGMRWCIRKGVDGVITDDPKLFNEVKFGREPDPRKGQFARLSTAILWWPVIFGFYFLLRCQEVYSSTVRIRVSNPPRKVSAGG